MVLEEICAGEGLVVKWKVGFTVVLEDSVHWKTGFDTGRNLCRGRFSVLLEEICAGEGLVVEWKTGCSIGGICPVEDWL